MLIFIGIKIVLSKRYMKTFKNVWEKFEDEKSSFILISCRATGSSPTIKERGVYQKIFNGNRMKEKEFAIVSREIGLAESIEGGLNPSNKTFFKCYV